ncbi:hypothetical protein [Hyphomicrobium sulfonivorans]|uniref:hypothetical protein n=1 Tax=Hyphomicrobium sulfonivorans TaxID=121290 RepID=UPI001570432D|nr:hypothetical protein [Hyphomicrobium sulfonivorans]MBI1651167.1 hypothetical protein [Hyphomicrobium sulfonivorans]NSL72449.1 hypothetical protein [Hyphomicrobium sulfonivorans]
MSSKAGKDSAGRNQPSKYLRKKRASNAAKHRWKAKQTLVPGVPKTWSERSFANKLRHLAAARKGGATTGVRIREQQHLFWNFYHGNCKVKLHGPFSVVVETFERIEAEYNQRYGPKYSNWMAWDGFFAQFLYSFVFSSCWSKAPEQLEQEMWELFEKYMAADEQALWNNGLMDRLVAYDDAQAEKKVRLALWRDKVAKASKTTKTI